MPSLVPRLLASCALSLVLLPASSQSVSGAPVSSATRPASAAAPSAGSAVRVEGAWVRASVPGQSGTGAFMRLTAAEPLRLVGVSSPVADVSEVHEMRMDGDVMRMRAIPGLDLPAGRPVDLQPGGYHLMLMALKSPLKAGTQVPVTLVLRDARGQLRRQEVQVPVALRAPAGPGAAARDPGHGHGQGQGQGQGQGHQHHHR